MLTLDIFFCTIGSEIDDSPAPPPPATLPPNVTDKDVELFKLAQEKASEVISIR